MDKQRVTLITLGVDDLERSKRFYSALGWTPHPSSATKIVFYQLQSSVLGLFNRAELAADQGRPDAVLGTGSVTLCQNYTTEGEVDGAYNAAIAAGAAVLKRPKKVFWGGYSGYYSDPDGHVWEIAMNPFWPLAQDGSLKLPAEA